MEHKALFPIRIDQPQAALNLCFTLTTRCNLNCAYCFNREARPVDMDPGLAYRLYQAYAALKTAPQTAIISVILFGGEPTLNYPTIQAIFRAAGEHGHKVLPRLVTNGVIAEALLERLIDEMYYFQISYDGAFGARMGAETEAIVRRTVRKVGEAGLPLFLRSTIHAGNVDQMVEIVQDAKRFGADTVGFAPVAMMGNAKRNAVARPRPEVYVDNFIKALECALDAGINVYSAEINYLSKRGRSSPAPTLVFLPDGSLSYSIKFCSAESAGARELVVGGYDPGTQRLEFAWERLAERARIFSANQPKTCGGCSAFQDCRSLNLFDLLSASEDPGPLDSYYCDITRMALKRLEGMNLSGNMPY
ncbi:MAG: radical SAM protein [Anaerolineae bacterium]|nr:radical SAM protein [Anaerolineae bacterium]